jgi:hypothetical protein
VLHHLQAGKSGKFWRADFEAENPANRGELRYNETTREVSAGTDEFANLLSQVMFGIDEILK